MTTSTLIILAGGRGERMGGRDKGLVELDQQPLVARLLATLDPLPPFCVISANRNQARYQQWADQVVADRREDFQGPLAGLEAALYATDGPCVCLPCDLLDPPAGLAERLLSALRPGHICVARDPQRRQPLCLALHAERWRDSLTLYLDNGGRSAHGWLDLQPCQPVLLPHPLQNLNHLPQ